VSSPRRSCDESMTFSRRRLIGAAGAIALVGKGVRAQTPVPTPARRQPADLRIAVRRMPTNWDPATQSLLEHIWLSTLLYDPVARWNAQGDIFPGLGLHWAASTFDRVLEITLRPDAFFLDGAQLTADDVRWTLERLRYSASLISDAWRLENIWRIEAPDTHIVRITLNAPDASLVSSLAAPSLSILAEASNPQRLRGGTGPFMVRFLGSDRAVFWRNPLFWQIGRPHFRALRISEIPDDTERSTALVTGMVDLVPDAPLLDIPTLQADPSVQLIGGPSNHLCLLHVNLRQGALQDVRVRQILSGAIDRVRVVKGATAGQGEASGLLFPSGSWVTGDVDDIEQQAPETVRAALAELGIRADLRLRLVTDNTDATLANTVIVLQEQLAYCGIALSVVLLEGEELANAIRFGEYDLLAGYTRPWRDPHELVRPLLASDGTANFSGYASPEVDGMIHGATFVSHREVRGERYLRLQERILADVPVIVLFRPYYFDAMTSRLANYGTLQPVTARGLMPATLDTSEETDPS